MDAYTIEQEIDDLFNLEKRDKETMVDGHYYKSERYRNFVRIFSNKIFSIIHGRCYKIRHNEEYNCPCIEIRNLRGTHLALETKHIRDKMTKISPNFPVESMIDNDTEVLFIPKPI